MSIDIYDHVSDPPENDSDIFSKYGLRSKFFEEDVRKLLLYLEEKGCKHMGQRAFEIKMNEYYNSNLKPPCSHKYPDGRSAIGGVLVYYCRLCGEQC